MPDRYLLPIPLAHGRSGNTGFLSIYFSPRLVTEGPLSTYPDWVNWPATLASFNFEILINGVKKAHTVVGAAPSSAKWTAVFPGKTDVGRWRVVDRTGTQVRSFEENTLTDSVRDIYGKVAAAYPSEPMFDDHSGGSRRPSRVRGTDADSRSRTSPIAPTASA